MKKREEDGERSEGTDRKRIVERGIGEGKRKGEEVRGIDEGKREGEEERGKGGSNCFVGHPTRWRSMEPLLLSSEVVATLRVYQPSCVQFSCAHIR